MRGDKGGAWFAFVAGALLTVAGVGCGRGGGITGPTSPPDATGAPPVAQRPADLPRALYGSFARSEDVPEVAANGGNVVLVIPSYADDARVVASALRANGKIAILSAHHVFGGPEATWEQGWRQTLAWAEPFAELIAAIYVVDEPLTWGMAPAVRDRAIARVRADGYRTMVAETAELALRTARPPVDLFGVTCYDWPGYGSRTLDQCRDAYRSHPEWNVAIGQGFDWHERSGSPAAQVAAWAEIGRGRDGVIFWVWDWPGQVGLRVDQGALAAYRKGAGW